MEQQESIRAMDELGRIVLPIEVRRAMDWGEKTPLTIYVNAEAREITLRGYANACTFCGETEDLMPYASKYICAACKHALSKL